VNNRQKIGSVLRRLRKKSKLTFRELASQSGIKSTTLYYIETGRGRLDASQLVLLTQVLGPEFSKEITRINTPKMKKVTR
jgi:transcriptional regulator with XRE-family HTH domain